MQLCQHIGPLSPQNCLHRYKNTGVGSQTSGQGQQTARLGQVLIRSGMKAQEIADALAISIGRVYQIDWSLGDDNPLKKKKPHQRCNSGADE